jgi:ABC-2 type transport system permease protein
MKRMYALIIKEFQQLRRDPAMMAIVLIVPVIQLLILGTAISTEVKNLPMGICDEDNSAISRQLTMAFASNRYIIPELITSNRPEIYEALEDGNILVGLTIPKGFAKKLEQGQNARMFLQIDGVDGNSASIATGYVNAVVTNYLLQRTGEKSDAIILPRFVFNEARDSSFHYVPGIIALLITVVSTLLTAFSLVKEKEMGTFEQLMVTPVGKMQFIVGKIAPFFILTFIELAISLFIIWPIYGIYPKSSVAILALGSAFYVFNTLSIGILISTITKTQQQALFLAWFTLIFAIMMSGFLFPLENMPDILQQMAAVNPLKYYILVLRGVLVKGMSLAELQSPLLTLLFLGSVMLSISVLTFRKSSN